MSKKFVTSHGLELANLVSKDFVAFDGTPIRKVTVIKEYVLDVGDIRASLNNAIALEDSNIVGVQMGMDFLESASWTQCCTRVPMDKTENHGSFVISDGGANVIMLGARPPIEELRCYSRTGATVRIPFIHIDNLGDSESLL